MEKNNSSLPPGIEKLFQEKNILSIKEYAEQIEIPEQTLFNNSRKYETKIPRQIYWFYLHKNGISTRLIGRLFNRHHTSVINGIRTITNLIHTNDQILLQYKNFLSTFLHLPPFN